MSISLFRSFLLLVSSAFLVQGQYYLDAEVSGHLPPATFIIKRGIVVPPGKELVIPADAELRFADSAGLDIYGGVIVGGTPSEPVIFGASSGKWKGISIYDGNQRIFLKDILVSNCSNGIYLSNSIDTLRLTLENAVFRGCEAAVVDAAGVEHLNVRGKAITGTCTTPGGDCELLRGYRPAVAVHNDQPPNKGFTLRRPTVPQKVGIALGAAAVVLLSLKVSMEYHW